MMMVTGGDEALLCYCAVVKAVEHHGSNVSLEHSAADVLCCQRDTIPVEKPAPVIGMCPK